MISTIDASAIDIDVQLVVDELRAAYGDKLPRPYWLVKEVVKARTKARSSGLEPIWVKDYAGCWDRTI